MGRFTLAVGSACVVVLGLVSVLPAATKIKTVFTDSTGSLPYNLLLPNSYSAAGAAKPVIIFLHGVGESGTDNNAQLNFFPGAMVTETQTGGHQAVMIAPQCPVDHTWGSQLNLVMKVLDSVESNYNVDESRIYITGLSLGGIGTWDALKRFPTRFAAGLPLSGIGDANAANTFKNIPIWAFHATNDDVVAYSGSSNPVNAIRAVNGNHINEDGGKLIFSTTTTGHGGWTDFYKPNTYRTDGLMTNASNSGRQDIYNWMFSKSIPEPTCLSAIAVGGSFLLRRKRR
ncbi:MAG: hypothetical protein JWM57_4346 [Phycisphaerales bacterium]|nr:hypothetical protein [Phycisphaerales bacterium]